MGGTWTSGPLYPETGGSDPDDDASGGVYDDKLYVCGGHEGVFSDDHDQHYYFDPSDYSWHQVAPMPLGGEGAMGCAVVGDYMYYVGGMLGLSGTAVATFWRYDPIADTWDTSLTQLPEGRSRGQVGEAGGKIYYGGGVTGNSTIKNTVYEYDIDLDTWTLKSNPPSARFEGTGAGSNGQFFMLCGQDSAGDRSDTVFAYDPDEDGWGTVGVHSPAKYDFAPNAFSKGDLIFLVGGNSVDGFAPTDFKTYDTGTNTIETLTDCPGSHSGDIQGLLNYDNEQYYVVVQVGSGAETDVYTTSDYSGLYGLEFTGTDGATIYPAPEKLPHVITRRDTLDNLPLQRKLQENFDSIERQLLALDPDNDPEGRNNPYR